MVVNRNVIDGCSSFLVLTLLCAVGCQVTPQATVEARLPSTAEFSFDGVKYSILDISCTPAAKCVVIAYCSPRHFNLNEMSKLARQLSDRFRSKSVVNVNVFDNRQIADGYAKGNRDIGDMQKERRAWYFRDRTREVFLFFPDHARLLDPISVNLTQ